MVPPIFISWKVITFNFQVIPLRFSKNQFSFGKELIGRFLWRLDHLMWKPMVFILRTEQKTLKVLIEKMRTAQHWPSPLQWTNINKFVDWWKWNTIAWSCKMSNILLVAIPHDLPSHLAIRCIKDVQCFSFFYQYNFFPPFDPIFSNLEIHSKKKSCNKFVVGVHNARLMKFYWPGKVFSSPKCFITWILQHFIKYFGGVAHVWNVLCYPHMANISDLYLPWYTNICCGRLLFLKFTSR